MDRKGKSWALEGEKRAKVVVWWGRGVGGQDSHSNCHPKGTDVRPAG